MKGRVVDSGGVGVEPFWERAARLERSPSFSKEKQPKIMGRGGLEKGFGAQYNYSFSHFAAGGGHRKPVDRQIGRPSRTCLSRVWVLVVTLASLLLLASVTPMGNSIQARIFYPRKLVSSYSQDSESSSQFLWDRRTEQMFAFSFDALRQKSDGGTASKTHPRSLTSHGGEPSPKPSSPTDAGQRRTEAAEVFTPFIEDLVILPEDLDLFIVRHASSVHGKRIYACRYGEGPELKSAPRMVDMLPDRRLGVSCTRPSSLRLQKTLKVENVSLELDGGAPALLPQTGGSLKPARWDQALVYAAQTTDEDVVLYVKNLFDSSKRKASEYTELGNFRCRFGEALETPVTAGAQEVFRCALPSVNPPTTFVARVKVHLLYKGKTIPSVAFYEPIRAVGDSTLAERVPAVESRGFWGLGSSSKPSFGGGGVRTTPEKKYLVCSCTMIWNVAKFLKEWVIFNSDLGVEKFFLYDNNSEDDIRRVVSELSEYNVTRITWPWIKTQEAGFSNCAIEAQRECTWILFTDVDEFLFPKRWLQLTEDEPKSGGARELAAATRPREASPLASLIDDTLKKVARIGVGNGSRAFFRKSIKRASSLQVGQISFLCRSFGPSGRTTSPSDGVTQGYTCRDLGEERHKSMVYFPALKSTLQNVIHHFQLRPQFQSVYLDVRQSVVHHYKYQAWSEFEKKFTKRASTYVVDWKEPKNLNSRDRPQGVGPEATKPSDWETRHCAANDTSLRDYTRRRYGIVGNGDAAKMAWEL